jgi:hypothetical protein
VVVATFIAVVGVDISNVILVIAKHAAVGQRKGIVGVFPLTKEQIRQLAGRAGRREAPGAMLLERKMPSIEGDIYPDVDMFCSVPDPFLRCYDIEDNRVDRGNTDPVPLYKGVSLVELLFHTRNDLNLLAGRGLLRFQDLSDCYGVYNTIISGDVWSDLYAINDNLRSALVAKGVASFVAWIKHRPFQLYTTDHPTGVRTALITLSQRGLQPDSGERGYLTANQAGLGTTTCTTRGAITLDVLPNVLALNTPTHAITLRAIAQHLNDAQDDRDTGTWLRGYVREAHAATGLTFKLEESGGTIHVIGRQREGQPPDYVIAVVDLTHVFLRAGGGLAF